MSGWEPVMQKHAKSFYLASLFFPNHLLPKVKALYALCRWLDDAVDEADSVGQAHQAVDEIHHDLVSVSPQLAVNQLYLENQLDVAYIEDLIDGAKQDLQLVRIQNREQLIQYCYKVAGTVGLAMFDLMKVKPNKVRANAVDLGIGMQITNICRDVAEDLKRDRVYIPEDLLKTHGLSHQLLLEGNFDERKLAAAVNDMLLLADHYYFSAQNAFINIPWRTRGAIIIASDLYRSIGLKLQKKHCLVMRGRTYLNSWEKIICVSKSVLKWLASAFKKPSNHHQSQLHNGLSHWKQTRNFEG